MFALLNLRNVKVHPNYHWLATERHRFRRRNCHGRAPPIFALNVVAGVVRWRLLGLQKFSPHPFPLGLRVHLDYVRS
jgi:hypothetical protein